MESFHCFQGTFIAILSFDPHNNPERWARETLISPFWHRKRSLQPQHLRGALGNVVICNCQVNFAVRAAWGETKRKRAYWPGAPLVFPDTFFPVHPHLHVSHAVRLSFPFSPLQIYSANRIWHLPQSQCFLFPFPTSCFSHHTYYLWTYYIFHLFTQCTCFWLPTGMWDSWR